MNVLLTPALRTAIYECGSVELHLEDCPYPDILNTVAQEVATGNKIALATIEDRSLCLVYSMVSETACLLGGWRYGNGNDIEFIDPVAFIQSKDMRDILEVGIKQRESNIKLRSSMDNQVFLGGLGAAFLFSLVGGLIPGMSGQNLMYASITLGVVVGVFLYLRRKAKVKVQLATDERLRDMRRTFAEMSA